MSEKGGGPVTIDYLAGVLRGIQTDYKKDRNDANRTMLALIEQGRRIERALSELRGDLHRQGERTERSLFELRETLEAELKFELLGRMTSIERLIERRLGELEDPFSTPEDGSSPGS